LKNKITKRPKKERRHIDYGRFLYAGFLCFCMISCFPGPIPAAAG